MNTIPLFAYIDPMSGAILIQMIVAFFVGGLAFFRRSIWAIFRTLLRIKPSAEEAST